MAMSKGDFIALADAVRSIGKIAISRGELEKLLANFCESRSSEFKRERWLAYIKNEVGPNGGPVK